MSSELWKAEFLLSAAAFLVAAAGAARPKEVFYGNNRADFSFIPGNVAPGKHPMKCR